MNLERIFHIRCTACWQTIWLTETMLEQIVRNPLVSNVGAPWLIFVCSGCMTGFHYNYEERELAALIPESDQKSDRKYPTAFVFRSGCVDDNCISLVQLTVIRDAGTTKEEILAAFPRWKLNGIVCEKEHRLLFPDPKKTY